MSGKKLVVEPIRKKPFEWQLGGVVAVYFQLLLALAWFLALPADISSVHIARLFAALGLLATWRYTWWFTHSPFNVPKKLSIGALSYQVPTPFMLTRMS